MQHLSMEAQVLLHEVRSQFGESVAPQPSSDKTARPGDISLTVPSPGHPGHFLEIAQYGTVVEVRYDDARPPGPAERLWIAPEGQFLAAAQGVGAFLSDLVNENVVVVRERLGWLTRLFRRDCEDLAWFREIEELAANTSARIVAVYSWHGTRSRPLARESGLTSA